jgi:hypothetical protein
MKSLALPVEPTLDEIVDERLTVAVFSVAPSTSASGCLSPAPSMPIAATSSRPSLM